MKTTRYGNYFGKYIRFLSDHLHLFKMQLTATIIRMYYEFFYHIRISKMNASNCIKAKRGENEEYCYKVLTLHMKCYIFAGR